MWWFREFWTEFFNADLYIAENNCKTQFSLGSFSFSLIFFRKVTSRRARSHFVWYAVSVEIVQLNEDSDIPRLHCISEVLLSYSVQPLEIFLT